MRRTLIILLMAVSASLTARAYDYVDSLTFYAEREQGPVYDLYHDAIYPNEVYWRCEKDTCTHVAKVAYSGDTAIVAYYSQQTPQELCKLERYQKTETGSLFRSGISEYFRNGQLYCSETYKKGHLSNVTWYDGNGQKQRRYVMSKDTVKQRIDMFPGTRKIMRIESYEAGKLGKTRYFDKQGHETQPVPPTYKGGFEAISEMLSKQFVLPNRFIVNQLSYTMSAAVSPEGHMSQLVLRLIGAIRFETYTKEENWSSQYHKPHFPVFPDFPKELDAALDSCLRKQFADNWTPGTIDGVPVSMMTSGNIHYSPFYFAQTGDVFYVDKRETVIQSISKIETLKSYDSYVRNNPSMPCIAVAERDGNQLSLKYFDRDTNEAFMLSRYVVDTPCHVVRQGIQELYFDDGHISRQTYVADTIRLAEEYDSLNHLCAKYTFRTEYSTKIAAKDEFYPSGMRKLHVDCAELAKDKDVIVYYREDGTQASFTPAKDVQKTIDNYVNSTLAVPKAVDPKTIEGINRIAFRAQYMAEISEKGELKFIEKLDGKIEWSYNYETHTTYPDKILKVINDLYLPSVQRYLEELVRTGIKCTPAYVEGVPVASKMIVAVTKKIIPVSMSKKERAEYLASKQQQSIVPDSILNEADGQPPVFKVVDRMPEFPGGQQALFRFLNENVRYPAIAKENRIQGRVICRFVVEKDGSITNVEVVSSGGHPSLDKEAVRVLKSMPKWSPGMQDGKAVRVQYTTSVNFKLE